MDLALCPVEADADPSKQDTWTVANVKHEMPDTPPRTPPTFIQRTSIKAVPSNAKNIHGLKIVFPVAMDDMTTVIATPTDRIKNELHAGKVKIQPKPPQNMTIVSNSGSNSE